MVRNKSEIIHSQSLTSKLGENTKILDLRLDLEFPRAFEIGEVMGPWKTARHRRRSGRGRQRRAGTGGDRRGRAAISAKLPIGPNISESASFSQNSQSVHDSTAFTRISIGSSATPPPSNPLPLEKQLYKIIVSATLI